MRILPVENLARVKLLFCIDLYSSQLFFFSPVDKGVTNIDSAGAYGPYIPPDNGYTARYDRTINQSKQWILFRRVTNVDVHGKENWCISRCLIKNF